MCQVDDYIDVPVNGTSSEAVGQCVDTLVNCIVHWSMHRVDDYIDVPEMVKISYRVSPAAKNSGHHYIATLQQ